MGPEPDVFPASAASAKSETLCLIESIDDERNLQDAVVHIPCGVDLIVSGWAVDVPNRDAAGGVWLDVDGRLYRAHYGIPRSDVAFSLRNAAFDPSGFVAAVPMASIGPRGLHRVTVRVMNHAASAYYVGRSISFDCK
jgi:hypothetical protein